MGLARRVGQNYRKVHSEKIIHAPLRYGHTAGAMEDDEGKDDEGPIEVFGVHRLELAPGTMSGYIGVRPNKSKKHPWQAWLSLRGEKRRNVGSFKSPRHAAVARAAAKACGAETLRSPRKQAPRNKGAAACRLPPIAPSLSLSITLTVVWLLGSHEPGQENAQRKAQPQPSRSPA